MEYPRPPKAKLTEKERLEKERLEDERLAALELMISDDDEEGSASDSNDGASDESSSLGLENSGESESESELEGSEEEELSDGDEEEEASNSEDSENEESESSEQQIVEEVKKRKASEELPNRSEKRQEKSGAVGNASFARPIPPYFVRFDVHSTTTDHDVALFFSRELYIFDVAHLARNSETITAYFNTKQAAENAITLLKKSKLSSNESLSSTSLLPGQCLLCWDDKIQRNRTCWWCVGEVTRADKNNGRGYVSVLTGRKPCSICAKFDHKAKSCPQNMSKRAKRKRREQEKAAEKKKQHQANAEIKRANIANPNNNHGKNATGSASAKSRRPETATKGSSRALAGQAKGRGKAPVSSVGGFRTVEHGGPVFSAVL